MGRPAKDKKAKKRLRSEDEPEDRESQDSVPNSQREKSKKAGKNKRPRIENEDEDREKDSQGSQGRSEESFQLSAAENGEFGLDELDKDKEVLSESDEEVDFNDKSMEVTENESQEQYEVTPVDEEQIAKVAAEKKTDREGQMMKDIGEFFNDAENLSRVWNLVKAINTSDKIKEASSQVKQGREESQKAKEDRSGDKAKSKYPKTGNRVGIDVTRLEYRGGSETTLYTQSSYTPPGNANGNLNELSSPEFISSDEGVSLVEITDAKSRLPPPEYIPLPPPPPRDEQPEPSTSRGWSGGVTERVKRMKQVAADQLEQAKMNKEIAAKPPGKSFELQVTNADDQESQAMDLVSNLIRKDSDLSTLVESLNSLTAEGEFDPLTVQLDGITQDKI